MSNVVRKIVINIIMVYFITIILFFVFSFFSSYAVYTGVNNKGLSDFQGNGYSLSIIENKGPAASFASSPPVLAVYKGKWILANTLALFIRYFLPVHLTAVLLSFSLILPYKYGPDRIRSSFLNIVGKTIIVFMVFTLLFMGLKEAVYPVIQKNIQEYTYFSKVGVDLLNKGNSAFKNSNYHDAERYFLSYLKIDKGNNAVKNIQSWTLAKLEVKERKPVPQKKASSDNEEQLTNYKRAENFFKEKNYFSAYYYALISSQADAVSLHEEAMKLMARAENSMQTLISESKDAKARILFEHKMNALNSLKAGNYFEAYTEFKSLYSKYPGDKDISDFFNICINKIKENAFFADEAEQYRYFPGLKNIVYSVKENSGVLDFIKIKKYVDTEKGEYFFNLELLKIDLGGDVKIHFTVPYGKLSKDGYIIFQSIDKGSGTIYKPKVLSGNGDKDALYGEKVPFSTENLIFFTGENSGLDDASLVYLYKMWKMRAEYGYLRSPVTAAILNRMVMPFSFFILSLWALYAGWVFRISKHALPWLAFPFIVIIPFILNRFLILWSSAYKIFISFLIFKTGPPAALAILLLAQGVLIFTGLLVLAREEKRG